MQMTFRWYGPKDPVTLEKIRQVPGVTGIVSAIYDVPVGQVWPQARIDELKAQVEAAGLSLEVIESVPVHEDIKLGRPARDGYIDAYCENIRRLGRAGIRCICYNFMPVFDWLRSELSRPREDGSFALAYDEEEVLAMDPATSELSLPGWDESYTKVQLRELLAQYGEVGEEKLWENLTYFLKKIIPVAEEANVRMAIHPDDPPWGIFGLPRIITGMASYERFIRAVDSPFNGVTLCYGSLGSSPDNDLVAITKFLGENGRIPFVHARNVKLTGYRRFEEAPHPTAFGSIDMYAVFKALHDTGFDGYVRPDHGRMIWGETGRPGYGLYDRALGATYLWGLWEAIGRA